MSAETLGLGVLVFAVVLGIVLFFVRRNQTYLHRTGKAPYRWEPEQDYDVVHKGESAMTPAWPELKRRVKKPPTKQ